MHRSCLLLLVAALGCGPPEDQPDADTAMGGLEVRWSGQGFDTEVGGARVEQLRLSLRDVRAVGDAAPGDDRTYLAAVEIELSGTNERLIEFDQAPPGRYSVLEQRIAPRVSGEESWVLLGKVIIDSEEYNLEIEDLASSSLGLSLAGLNLTAGETRTVHVSVDVPAIVAGIDWASVPLVDGELQIGSTSPLLPTFRDRLLAAIQIGAID